MAPISKLELVKVGTTPPSLMDFVVDGEPLLERFPLRDFDDSSEDQSIDEEWARLFRQGFFKTRIGWGSVEWRRRALRQLLLLDPPELDCGRRRLYTCPLCDCCHLACRIEFQDAQYIWRDFVRGSPTGENGMEGWQDGEWKRVMCPPIEGPAKEFKMHLDPLYFEQRPYESLFEPLLAALPGE